MDQHEQMEFFYEIFDASLPRLGPGDDLSTKKALTMLLSIRPRIGNAADTPVLRILDIGCGNGAQTIQLAKYTNGSIVVLDNHQPFLDELRRRAKAEGVLQKIRPYLRDMHDMGLDDGSFDLIWAEGSLYIIGFREGLKSCYDLLISDGLLAASELSWLRPDPPAECRDFFANEYPAMTDIETNISCIKSCGYEVLGNFTLPESAWWEPYYHPMEERLQTLRKKYAEDPEKMGMIESIQKEIDIYRQYSDYYGNVFYLMRRR
jgi:SAM-dependent methyltransferase